jgi:hypothetical protein
MKALYDAGANLVGWYEPATADIWDPTMHWVAYVVDGNAWSVEGDRWCGPVDGTTCLDRQGCVVAWGSDQKPEGTAIPVTPTPPVRPITPMTPETPMTPPEPLTPQTPVGGWSVMSFGGWLEGR